MSHESPSADPAGGRARPNNGSEQPPLSIPPGGRRCIVLALPEDELFAPIVHAGLAAAGWKPEFLHDIGALPRVAKEPDVALIVLDVALPEARRVLFRLKLHLATNWVPVVALFPRGATPQRPAHLRVQADVELVEPVPVDRLIAAAQRMAFRSLDPPSNRKVRIVLPSRRADLERAVEIAAALLAQSPLDEDGQTSLLAAFREALVNAITHGNQLDPAKRVRVDYRQNTAAITIAVHDEGRGFDAQAHLRAASDTDAAAAARDRHRQGRHGGLGILMLLRCTDRVAYSPAGNTVTLTKLLRPAAATGGRTEPPPPPKNP